MQNDNRPIPPNARAVRDAANAPHPRGTMVGRTRDGRPVAWSDGTRTPSVAGR